MIAKYKNSQVVYLDGVKPVKIRRVIKKESEFAYELKETGEIITEERLSLIKK
jgi:hypothetical protein